jgi:hypothetical protein
MSIREYALPLRIELHKGLITSGSLPSCLSCEHMINSNVLLGTTPWFEPVFCEKFKMKPPIQVVVIGCTSWEEGIPF